MLCRDFNITPDPSLDSTSKPKRSPPSLKMVIRTYKLYDAWRYLNTNDKDYSFFSNSHRSYSRIDLFLVDKWLLFKCKSVKINTIPWSDHASVKLAAGDSTTHNPTFIWRSNPRLFQDALTKSKIEQQLSEFFKNIRKSVTDPFTVWNAHKAFVRGILIQQGARIKRMRQHPAMSSDCSSWRTFKKPPGDSNCPIIRVAAEQENFWLTGLEDTDIKFA